MSDNRTMNTLREEKITDHFTKYLFNIDMKFPFSINRFTGANLNENPHDHNCDFRTHILKGSYVEEIFTIQPDGTWRTEEVYRMAGSIVYIKAEHIHRIIELPDGECWSAMIPEPERRDWREWRFDENGISFRPWNKKDFTPFTIKNDHSQDEQ